MFQLCGSGHLTCLNNNNKQNSNKTTQAAYSLSATVVSILLFLSILTDLTGSTCYRYHQLGSVDWQGREGEIFLPSFGTSLFGTSSLKLHRCNKWSDKSGTNTRRALSLLFFFSLTPMCLSEVKIKMVTVKKS